MSDFKSRLPRDLYSAAQLRALDRIAIDECQIPGIELMGRAATATFKLMLELYPQVKHVVVLAGGGNNGGDGYLVAALAKEQGLKVQLHQVGDHGDLKGDALLAQQQALNHGVSCVAANSLAQTKEALRVSQSVIIDAIFGTGLDRPVSAPVANLIQLVNGANLPVLAVDVPSGICSNTGRVLGAAIKADATATFIGMKRGLLTHQAVDHCGTIYYFTLDVPDKVLHGTRSLGPLWRRIDMQGLGPLLLPRTASAHKGDFGHVLIVGGEQGFGGAVMMAGEAALRCGSGLVSLLTRPEHRAAALARCPELMVHGCDVVSETEEALLARASVIVVGPGLGRSSWSRALLQAALRRQLSGAVSLVIDADGLNLLAEKNPQASGTRRGNWILTPHPGEASRLLDCSVEEVQCDRFTSVERLQQRWGGHCLLKGAGSVLASEAEAGVELSLCSEGNPGMATAGMGDILSGIVGGLLAQGFPPGQALQLAVCLHGESADLAAAAAGQRGMLATDLFPYLRQLLNPRR